MIRARLKGIVRNLVILAAISGITISLLGCGETIGSKNEIQEATFDVRTELERQHEENLSYKRFIRNEIYMSEKLGKITPNTTFAPDGEIISHGGKMEFEKVFMEYEEGMSYVLYKPSCINNDEKLPLIVYLHGAGDSARSIAGAERVGLPKALSEWKLDGFHSYILCLQNPGGGWRGSEKFNDVIATVSKVCQEFPINLKKVSIVGHSSGGGGAIYVNSKSGGMFCAVVPISAVKATPHEENLNGARMRAYLASGDGEGHLMWYFETKLKPVAGTEQSFRIRATHLESGEIAFTQDKNRDGKSDLVEWLLSQKRE